MPQQTYDVVIIGAGVVGTALARALSGFDLAVLVLEAADDVGSGATRANSGIVHGGYASKNGSRKAEFCLAGNRLFDDLARELDIPFARIGSVVLAFREDDMEVLESLRENGRANGVADLEIAGREDTLRRVPRLNPAEVVGGLFCPGAGIVSPYEFCVALAENALANGVEFRLESPPSALEAEAGGIRIATERGEVQARFVVNAAGAGAADVAILAGPPPFQMRPRKGQYIVFRRGSSAGLDTVVFQPPGPKGKGILVTPTAWGNLMVGPDAQETQDPADLGTDPASLARVIRTARRSIADFDLKQAIRVFSGVRPAASRGDFILEWSDRLPGMLHLAGIESPGLTASPALALEAVRLLREAGLELREKRDADRFRKAPVRPGPLGPPAEAARDAGRPVGDPGRIVCRCEQVKESQIRDALSRGLILRSTDAVKRRTRAGMGACQGTFCGPRVRDLVAEAAGIEPDQVRMPLRDRQAIRADLDEMRRLLSEDEASKVS